MDYINPRRMAEIMVNYLAEGNLRQSSWDELTEEDQDLFSEALEVAADELGYDYI